MPLSCECGCVSAQRQGCSRARLLPGAGGNTPHRACCCPAEMSPTRRRTVATATAPAAWTLPKPACPASWQRLASFPTLPSDTVWTPSTPQASRSGGVCSGGVLALAALSNARPRADGRSSGCCVPRHATTPPHPLMRPLPTPPGSRLLAGPGAAAPAGQPAPAELSLAVGGQPDQCPDWLLGGAGVCDHWWRRDGGGGQGVLRCIAIDTMQPACCLAALPAAHPALPGSSPAAAAATPCPPQAVGILALLDSGTPTLELPDEAVSAYTDAVKAAVAADPQLKLKSVRAVTERVLGPGYLALPLLPAGALPAGLLLPAGASGQPALPAPPGCPCSLTPSRCLGLLRKPCGRPSPTLRSRCWAAPRRVSVRVC